VSATAVGAIWEAFVTWTTAKISKGNSVVIPDFASFGFHTTQLFEKCIFMNIDQEFLHTNGLFFRISEGFQGKVFKENLSIKINIAEIASIVRMDKRMVN